MTFRPLLVIYVSDLHRSLVTFIHQKRKTKLDSVGTASSKNHNRTSIVQAFGLVVLAYMGESSFLKNVAIKNFIWLTIIKLDRAAKHSSEEELDCVF